MAYSLYVYSKCFANLLGGEGAGDSFAVDYLSDTIKCMLTTSSYAPNQDTDEVVDTPDNNEVSGTNYVAGGATLGSKTITVTAAAAWATTWLANTVYAVGDVVRKVSSNGHLYRCIVAGTSHASTEPTWPTVSGQTVTDNTVTWAEIGRAITQIDAADPSWASSTIANARYAVFYKDTGTPSTSPLLCYIDFAADKSTEAGTFTVVLAALGLFHFFNP